MTDPPHRIHCVLAQLFLQIISLYKPNSVLSRYSTFHLNCTFDHPVNNILCSPSLTIIIEEDRMKVSIPDVANNATKDVILEHVGLCFFDYLGEP